jgi:O-antigen/teichoic acid export membrane protein
VVAAVVSIVLARILSPTDYGTVALINVFINVLNVFISAGFSGALIQKKKADDVDFSSVFYVQLVICIILYVLLFICAPLIADFMAYQKCVQ